jgi:MFS family permease
MSSSKATLWMIWIIASIFYAYQYILRVMPNIMLDDIMLQFNIGAGTFGQFSGVYYIGYALMQIPIGIMLDRFGPRKVMTGCILLTVVGMLPLIFSSHWIYPIIGRLFIGIGSGAAILGVFKIIRMTFSEERFPRMLSFSVMIGVIGAIYGGGPVSYMRDVFGYQAVVQIFAAVGVALAILTYWLIPEMKSAPNETVLSEIKEVFGNIKVVLCCIFAGLMLGPLEGFADVWGSTFLRQVNGFEPSVAAGLPSMIFIGMCFGAPLLNFIAEKMGNYLAAIIGAGIIMTAVFTSLLLWPLTQETLSVAFILAGICCAYQILAIYKASTYVREEVAGLTTAVANMFIMAFGYFFHSIIGWTINAMGGPNSREALFFGVAVIPVGLLIGTLGFIFLQVKEIKVKAIN